ncbi:MAG TPA: hypothetical protein VMN04_03690, partial [Thermoanaerobaculia bacterium]|nr:hypothetical protein [Thermoanaerobaculia bacterium]
MRTTPRLAMPLVFAGALVAVAGAAAAEDFEFDVPVELSKIEPGVTQGRIDCSVYGYGFGDRRDLTNVLFGGGSTTFALKDGSFKSTVSVKFNVDRTLHNPIDAGHWVCILNLLSLSASHPFCSVDTATGQMRPRPPAGLTLENQSIKGCTQGDLARPGK